MPGRQARLPMARARCAVPDMSRGPQGGEDPSCSALVETVRLAVSHAPCPGDEIDKRIESLSGGERSRLVLARMLYDPPNFLVLDEPTNHLDLETKQMLVQTLAGFDGTMVFVSHDRTFLKGLATRVLDLSGGGDGLSSQPLVFHGDYQRWVERTGHEAPGVHR